MEYQALYRKYRPKTFSDVYGQDIIVKTLQNSIKNNKLTHAYLFIGPRGTGKTSIAKIFAKTINCENLSDGISCEKCSTCLSNNSNENVDVIEMDAASNNGVNEIREIKNHVTLLPTYSKYKVYIIDEVHMLTKEAFNALLKTLEEPPKHVIFILATTEPHKIPLTIVSRCQSFEFKPIPKNIIVERLKYISDCENIDVDSDSLELIALDSNGGMRDAIGMLDQLNSYCDNKITKEDVILLNGRISENEIEKFLENIIKNNIKECFEFSTLIDNEGKNYVYICEDIIKFLRDILIKRQMDKSNDIFKNIDNDEMMQIIYIFNNSISEMENSKDKKIFFDLSILQILQKINNQTNVHNKKDDKIIVDNSIKEKIESNVNEQKEINKKDYTLYDELMDIRINNILMSANKNSLKEYEQILKNLENNVTNLDELKIINLLEEAKICAGSKDGLIIEIDNENLLNELYENYESIEKIFENILSKKVNVCIVMNKKWLEKRPIYVEKIKNKEKILYIDEKDILNKINSLYNKSNSHNEFEDLLEIGGE